MTKTLEELEEMDRRLAALEAAGIDDLRVRMRKLEVLIQGEPDLHEQWAKNKKLGITPNIPEPSVGLVGVFESLIDRLNTRITETQATIAAHQRTVSEDVAGRFAFVRRLEAFFGPMLENKNPPLDGALVADKAYVDEAIARVARAIREEIVPSMTMASAITWAFRPGHGMGKDVFVQFANKMRWLLDREAIRAEREKRNLPWRIRSAVRALLGDPPQAGAR